MKCKVCGAPTRVLETRESENHTTLRRRECERGHRFTTYEIGASAYSNVRPRVAQYAAAEALRIRRWLRNQAIVCDPRSSREVAKEMGINSSQVRRIRRTHL